MTIKQKKTWKHFYSNYAIQCWWKITRNNNTVENTDSNMHTSWNNLHSDNVVVTHNLQEILCSDANPYNILHSKESDKITSTIYWLQRAAASSSYSHGCRSYPPKWIWGTPPCSIWLRRRINNNILKTFT